MDELTLDNVQMLRYLDMNFYEYDSIKDKPKTANETSSVVMAISRRNDVYFHSHIADLFNIFVTMVMFRIQPHNLVLLTVDDHSKLYIDKTLQVLFGPVIRFTQVTQSTRLATAVFPLNTKHNPLRQQDRLTQPYLEQFRQFVLQQYFIKHTGISKRKCDPVTVTITWQRDSNHVQAKWLGKMFNEAEVYEAIQKKLPTACVRGFLIEILPIQEQLEIIHETDILVAMHGEVLQHAVFLSPGTAVVELLPYRVYRDREKFIDCHTLCTWRGLHYKEWRNMDEKNDMQNYFTVVNATAVAELVYSMMKVVCRDINQ